MSSRCRSEDICYLRYDKFEVFVTNVLEISDGLITTTRCTYCIIPMTFLICCRWDIFKFGKPWHGMYMMTSGHWQTHLPHDSPFVRGIRRSPVVLQSFVFFVVRVNRLLEKWSSWLWFEKPWRPCDATAMILPYHKETPPVYCTHTDVISFTAVLFVLYQIGLQLMRG